jgi:hypothetical protein
VSELIVRELRLRTYDTVVAAAASCAEAAAVTVRAVSSLPAVQGTVEHLATRYSRRRDGLEGRDLH